MAATTDAMTLAKLNGDYRQLGCIGCGGFANVFLAQKKSGRKVALKVIRWDDDNNNVPSRPQQQHNSNDGSSSDDEDTKSDKEIKLDVFARELDTILKLDDDESAPTPPSIIYFEDWFTGPNFACIVMTFADGGTLAQEIVQKASMSPVEPYTERRIGFYMLQLMQALDFAHQKGVAHMDVKSANVLIHKGGKNGHQLVLTDWGSACMLDGSDTTPLNTMAQTSTPIESMTELYASPEFQNAFNQRNFEGLAPIPIDSFALGCILYELLCCKKMVDLAEHDNETLGEYIGKHNSVEHALQSQCLRLPFDDGNNSVSVCYSLVLRHLLGSLLDPNPSTRHHPSALLEPLQNYHASPIIADSVAAAQPPCPGAPLTIDNIQLGMFVQRGRDWSEHQEVDGGLGCVGVVTKLDPDCGYTQVTFPYKSPFAQRPEPITCRIGAGNKFELNVGPTPIRDFFTADGSVGALSNGIVDVNSDNKTIFRAGQMVNDGKCMIVAVRNQRLFIAPTERIFVTPLGVPPAVALFLQPTPAPTFTPPAPRFPPQDSVAVPNTWQAQAEPNNSQVVRLVDVTSGPERSTIVDKFYAVAGGMDIQGYEITKIQRVQSPSMWSEYVQCRETVVGENWGISDEKLLFHGTDSFDPIELLSSPSVALPTFYSSGAQSNTFELSSRATFADNKSWRETGSDIRRIVLSRVELGRAKNEFWSRSDNAIDYHSIKSFGSTEYDSCIISNPFQAYPEYIITYKRIWNGPQPQRRIYRAVRANNASTPSQRSAPRRALPPRPQQMMSPSLVDALPSIPQQEPTPVLTPSTNIPSTPPRSQPTAVDTAQTTESPSKVKECVICMERRVSHVLVPCGHPCLCEICATPQGLSKLRSRKCPECRMEFREAIRFFGTVVEEE